MNRLLTFSFIAFVAVGAQVLASPLGAEPLEDLRVNLIMFEVYSNGVEKVNMEDLDFYWDSQTANAIRNLLTDEKNAQEIENLPRLRILADVLKNNPTQELEPIFNSYKEERNKVLGGTDNFDTIRNKATGKLILSLICPKQPGEESISEEQFQESFNEIWKQVHTPVETLTQLEEGVTFVGSMPVKLMAEMGFREYKQFSTPAPEVAAMLRQELEKVGATVKC